MLETERVMARVAVNPFTGCWLWCGAISDNGYGNLSFRGRVQSAHRVAYMLFVEPIPAGHDVHHWCRIKHCVNPAHLVARSRIGHAAEHPAPPTCPKGHTEFRIKRGRWRECKVCHRDRERERRRC